MMAGPRAAGMHQFLLSQHVTMLSLIQKILYQLSHPSSFTEDFNSKSFKHFNIKACKIRLGMFVPTFNSITCEAEAGVSL